MGAMDTTTETTNTGPTIDPAAGELAADDPRSAYAGASAVTLDVIRSIEAEQYELPTPCEDMNVGELCEHLVMVQRRIACAGRGEPVAGWPVDAADVPRGGWADAFLEASHDVQQAWTADVLDRPTELPWGTFPGRDALGVYVDELVVHAWDLSRATGQDPEWDPDVLEVASVAIHQQLPVADRRPMWEAIAATLPEGVEWRDPFGNAVDVPDDAPAIDRLVAWNGRQP